MKQWLLGCSPNPQARQQTMWTTLPTLPALTYMSNLSLSNDSAHQIRRLRLLFAVTNGNKLLRSCSSAMWQGGFLPFWRSVHVCLCFGGGAAATPFQIKCGRRRKQVEEVALHQSPLNVNTALTQQASGRARHASVPGRQWLGIPGRSPPRH